MIVKDWSKYRNFSKSEFDCQETGENRMRAIYMDRIQCLRDRYGPMTVNSGFRSHLHSLERDKPGGPGPHNTGLSADFYVGPGEDAWRFLEFAFQLKFNGIGVSQRDGIPRFIHLDMLPRKAVWSY